MKINNDKLAKKVLFAAVSAIIGFALGMAYNAIFKTPLVLFSGTVIMGAILFTAAALISMFMDKSALERKSMDVEIDGVYIGMLSAVFMSLGTLACLVYYGQIVSGLSAFLAVLILITFATVAGIFIGAIAVILITMLLPDLIHPNPGAQ